MLTPGNKFEIEDHRDQDWSWFENELIDREDVDLHMLVVYIALARYAGQKRVCFPSLKTLQTASRLGKTSVTKALKDLEKAKLIRREQRFKPNGEPDSTKYYLLSAKKDCQNEDMAVRHTNNPHVRNTNNPVRMANTNKEVVVYKNINNTLTTTDQPEEISKIKRRLTKSSISAKDDLLNNLLAQFGYNAISDAADILIFNFRAGVTIGRLDRYLPSLCKQAKEGTLSRPAGFIFTREKVKEAAEKVAQKKKEKEDIVGEQDFKEGLKKVLGP
jgi:hypothetical protein